MFFFKFLLLKVSDTNTDITHMPKPDPKIVIYWITDCYDFLDRGNMYDSEQHNSKNDTKSILFFIKFWLH